MNEWGRALACYGKQRFESFEQAQQIARWARKRKNAMRQQSYSCPACGGYHVGTQPVRRPERALERR